MIDIVTLGLYNKFISQTWICYSMTMVHAYRGDMIQDFHDLIWRRNRSCKVKV